MEKVIFKVYEYELKKKGDEIVKGSYTIKENVPPLQYKNEQLISSFETVIYTKEEREERLNNL